MQTVALTPRDQIIRAHGPPARVISVRRTPRFESTYNLDVADFHTYFVGKDLLWVHNAPFAKAASPIWRALRDFRGALKTDGSRIFKWDFTHNDIEVFNSRGGHLGSMDPETGEMIKPPVAGITENVR